MSKSLVDLSRRERQIMDIIYKESKMSAADLREVLPGNLTDSGVRTLLRVLVNKGYLKREEKDFKYIYFPAIPLENARSSALQHVKEFFFNDSPDQMISALVKNSDISEEDLDKCMKIIQKAKKEGK